MDLFCPHCTRRVSVADDNAGQVLSCPLCAKQFQAPALAPPAVAPKPPAPPLPPPSVPVSEGLYEVGPPPPKPPLSPLPPIPQPRQVAPPEPEAPPLPPGEYTRAIACSLNADWLTFVPPVCLLAILVLSFFNWHLTVRSFPSSLRESETLPAQNLWQLASGQASYLAYLILLVLGFVAAVKACLSEKKILPTPAPFTSVIPFKDLVVGLILLLSLLLLGHDSVNIHLFETINPLALAFKIAFRLHFIAMLASFGMFWLTWRRRKNLPPPTVEARW